MWHFLCVHAENYQHFDDCQLGMFKCLKEVVDDKQGDLHPTCDSLLTYQEALTILNSVISAYYDVIPILFSTVLSLELVPVASLLSLLVDA